MSGCFTYQAGIFGEKNGFFLTFCGLIWAASGEILMPNDLIALGFYSYKST